MRQFKIIGLIVVAIIRFIGGYFTGSMNNNEASREIRIGYKNIENPTQVDYHHVFKDNEEQSIVDNFLMIYLHKEKIENVNLDAETPDIYIKVTSPKRSVGLIDSRLWFTNEGAIIGQRSGESWEEVEYYRINIGDANYIKDNIDYQQS